MTKIARGDLNAVYAKIRERQQAGKDATAFASDPNFYSCLVFDTAEQRDTFLQVICECGRELGVEIHGARYIDGRAVAAALTIELPESPGTITRPFRLAPKLADIAMTMDEHLEIPLPDEAVEIQYMGPVEDDDLSWRDLLTEEIDGD